MQNAPVTPLTGCRRRLKDSARPTLDKINLKNRQHAPAKSARPFNVECAPSMSAPRGTVWAGAGLKIRDCRHWRGGRIQVPRADSHPFPYLPIHIPDKYRVFEVNFVEGCSFQIVSLALIPACLAMAALALDGPAQRGQGHNGQYRGSPMECRGLLRPTGVQAVSLGPLALYFDRDRCHQGRLSCKFTATTAPKRIPNDFSQ